MQYRNRQGEPISLMEWADLFEDKDYIFVGRDLLAHPETKMVYDVITVWVGHTLDDGPNIIFETAVYRPDSSPRIVGRYSTEKEAAEGHALACWVVLRLFAEGEIHTEWTGPMSLVEVVMKGVLL